MAPVTDSPPPTYRLTEEQALLRDAVRTLADERVAPRAAEIDKTGEFPQDLRELLATQDILALPFPEAHGGLGGELLPMCLAIEQLSRACATTGLILAVQELGSTPLLLAGSDEQKERWVPDLAARVRRQPSLGDGAGRGEPEARAAAATREHRSREACGACTSRPNLRQDPLHPSGTGLGKGQLPATAAHGNR